eukprot:g9071.t1
MACQGETDLKKLISGMRPKLNTGDFVFCSIPRNSKDLYSSIPRDKVIMEFKEREGITLILDKNNADKFCLKYEYVAAWLTLEIHSALDAVGLTAAVSSSLAAANISANVVAAYHHDHIFVNAKDGTKALDVLESLCCKK